MGFPHDKTTHYFRLLVDGGAIEVTANDTKDSEDIQAIRLHLTHIVSMFSHGDFSLPMFIHNQVPPGATAMNDFLRFQIEDHHTADATDVSRLKER